MEHCGANRIAMNRAKREVIWQRKKGRKEEVPYIKKKD